MKINTIPKDLQEQIIKNINEAEDKGAAIAEGMEQLAAAYNQDLVDAILEEAEDGREERHAVRFRGPD